MLLLSRFSRVPLCATPQTAAHQAPPSLGFSRQEHWSGSPFPSPMHEVKSESEVAQSGPTLSDPMACSPPGSSHGIFQARVLEWGAIAVSNYLLQLLFIKRAKNCCAPTVSQAVDFALYLDYLIYSSLQFYEEGTTIFMSTLQSEELRLLGEEMCLRLQSQKPSRRETFALQCIHCAGRPCSEKLGVTC